MSKPNIGIRWAPRVSPNKIRRLYEAYVRGITDEELLDDVAIGLYARCASILAVKAAKEGRVTCPSCNATILRQRNEKNEHIRCGNCSWETSWFEYRSTFLRKQLNHGGAAEVFETYVKRFDQAHSAGEKMMLIDWLIHEFHKPFLPGGDQVQVRPVVANVIEGSESELAEFLHELAYGPAGSPEKQAAHEEWLAGWREGRKRYSAMVRERNRKISE